MANSKTHDVYDDVAWWALMPYNEQMRLLLSVNLLLIVHVVIIFYLNTGDYINRGVMAIEFCIDGCIAVLNVEGWPRACVA